MEIHGNQITLARRRSVVPSGTPALGGKIVKFACCTWVMLCACSIASAQRQMEKIDRGVVAINEGDGKVFVSWRLLADDPPDVRFYLYRQLGDERPQIVTKEPIELKTNFVNTGVPL